jgi:hypothetical protein
MNKSYRGHTYRYSVQGTKTANGSFKLIKLLLWIDEVQVPKTPGSQFEQPKISNSQEEISDYTDQAARNLIDDMIAAEKPAGNS